MRVSDRRTELNCKGKRKTEEFNRLKLKTLWGSLKKSLFLKIDFSYKISVIVANDFDF